MNATRIDELARILARRTSRRRVLAGSAGLFGLAATARVSVPVAVAQETCAAELATCTVDADCCATLRCAPVDGGGGGSICYLIGFETGSAVVVSDGPLNFRTSPGFTGSIVAKLPTGSALTVVDGAYQISDGFHWYLVSDSTHGQGWAAYEFLSLAAAPTCAAETTACSSDDDCCAGLTCRTFLGASVCLEATFADGSAVEVSDGPINFRASPGFDGVIQSTLPSGTRMTVMQGYAIEDGFDWYQLTSNGTGDGWAASAFLTAVTAPTAFASGQAVATIGLINFRSAAGLSGSVKATLPGGTVLSIVEGPSSADGYDWYKATLPSSGEGWVAGAFLERADVDGGTFDNGDGVTVVDGPVNFRAQPGLAGAVLRALPNDAALTVGAGPVARDGYDWYNLGSDAFGQGWTASAFLTASAATAGA